MKYVVFFSLVFFCIIAVLTARNLPADKYLQLQDISERFLFQNPGSALSGPLEKKLNAWYGYCESSVKIPFTVPFQLKGLNIICQTPASPKTFLITGEGNVTIRRYSGRNPSLRVTDGKIEVVSEQLRMDLLYPGFDVQLSSDGDTRFAIFEEDTRSTLFVVLGKLSLAYGPASNPGPGKALNIHVSSGGEILYEGKPLPMRNNAAVLQPMGFRELPPETAPLPPPPDAAAIPLSTATSTATAPAKPAPAK